MARRGGVSDAALQAARPERQMSAFAAIGDSASSGLPDRPASPRRSSPRVLAIDASHLGGCLDLGFLGSRPFRREVPDGTYWILLDFLGFSRLNLDFSMGYADFSQAGFFARLAPRDVSRARRRASLSACGTAWSLMGEDLTAISDFLQAFVVRGARSASTWSAAKRRMPVLREKARGNPRDLRKS